MSATLFVFAIISMQLPYFYEPAINQNEKLHVLSPETAAHCGQVLRMQKGSRMVLVNGKGLTATATIASISKKEAVVSIEGTKVTVSPSKKIKIAISLLKNRVRFEWFLEKAVEIGVSEITLLTCARTEKSQFRKERLEKILIAAMLQSRQTHLVKINEPVNFVDFVEVNRSEKKFIAHCEDSAKKLLSGYCPVIENALILIGPEGDFTPEEIKLAVANNFLPVSLGATRLRTETAGVYGAVLLSI